MANLGVPQARRRLVTGVVSLGVAAALLGLMVQMDAARAWRGVLFLPLVGAGLGFFQYREKT